MVQYKHLKYHGDFTTLTKDYKHRHCTVVVLKISGSSLPHYRKEYMLRESTVRGFTISRRSYHTNERTYAS